MMHRPVLLRIVCVFVLFGWVSSSDTVLRAQDGLTYPEARRSDQQDTYFGTVVPDPYRWLEDPDSEETRAWVEAQNEVTFDYLGGIAEREAIRSRLTELWNYERYGVPVHRGEFYFYTRNDGLQNQSPLYVATSLDEEPRLLLDPNTLSEDGTVALAGWVPSDDGRYLACSLAEAGSDWRTIRVLEVATGEMLEDEIRWVKFSDMSWTADNGGIFYSRYDAPEEGEEFTGQNYYQKLYFHRLGDEQSEDVLVYERRDEKEWGFNGEVTEDGRYALIHVWRGTEDKNQVFYKDLEQPSEEVVELIRGFEAEFTFVGNDGPVFWFLTDLDAPRRRVIAINTHHPEREHWQELIAEADNTLQSVTVAGDGFLATYLQDARSRILVYDRNGGRTGEVDLPGIGAVGNVVGRQDQREAFFSFNGFTTPSTVYRYDTQEATTSAVWDLDIAYDPSDFETEQVFFESPDGTRIPMFLTYRRGLERDGTNPTLLYGYGGFNISITPRFSVANVVWLEMGGIYAVANLRGGGEYGREWHEEGMLLDKQNVFDDFIAAAEWLVAEKYTQPEKLAIQGRSNGGLLVGAAMTQRPELFGATLPGVGVMDMLRYHKFTIGWAWVSEYGSSEDPEQFPNLLSYSPLHNLEPGTEYPATLITTADHDDRVVPGHSFKFAAALQHAHRGDNPVLIRIETSAGHGAGTPTSKRIEEAADTFAFLVAALGMDVDLPIAAEAEAAADTGKR